MQGKMFDNWQGIGQYTSRETSICSKSQFNYSKVSTDFLQLISEIKPNPAANKRFQ